MPTETDRELSDDEVAALLTDDEREWLPSDGPWNIPHGNCMRRERQWLLRLAAERRTVRELRAELEQVTAKRDEWRELWQSCDEGRDRLIDQYAVTAAKNEREACAAMVEQEVGENVEGFPVYSESNRERLSLLIVRIRARGDAGGAHE